MFRIFLIDLIQKARVIDEALNETKTFFKNRRIYERFDLNRQQIKLLNEQDILVVRDISQKGFSTEVSGRSHQRMNIGDVYRCKIRYLNENYSSNLLVRWKSPGHVGFELVQPSREVSDFMDRLILPLEIGHSLKITGGKNGERRDNEGMLWYHGTEGSNLFVWRDDADHLKRWVLESGEHFIQWERNIGFATGILASDKESNFFLENALKPISSYDQAPNPGLVQFARDVLMAAAIKEKQDIVDTLVEI